MMRRFRHSDLADVRQLIWRTIDVSYEGVYPPGVIGFFKEFHSDSAILERAEKGHIVVVEDEDRLLATGALIAGEILGVFVAPDRQGEGLGSSVMDELEALALEAGRSWVRLSISLPSLTFYERRGYVVTLECSHDLGGGERLDYWEAEKRLGGEKVTPHCPSA